ncbi:hypothetical protein [Paraburkholderia fungorum]|uniref:hypothetical protein n=1 Tax=Paraburkholderia fungorum TaxID=134537 RepID=UPI0038B9C3C9
MRHVKTSFSRGVWISSVLSKLDFAIAAIGFLLLTLWKVPPLAVVVFCVLAGIAQAALL